MPKDMRTWISQLEEAGLLRTITKPIDPLTQMSSVLYQSRDMGVLFENLQGFPGWRSLGQAPANPSIAAIAFDVPPEKLVPFIAERRRRPIPCVEVTEGPVKEVILKGDKVDLTRLPVQVCGARDAGPYISSGLCITKDPDTGQRNMSIHRMQVKGSQKTGILMLPRHSYMTYQKYEARNEPMPLAVCIGHHPAYYIAAVTTGPREMDELEIAGGLLGEPVPMIKCESLPLEVPANAEIVLEGYVLPHVRELEGPYSEFQDYYMTGKGENPIFEVHTITMRRDAIYKNVQNGSEVEGCVYHKLPFAATIYERIRSIGGYVDLKNVAILPGIFGVVVQMTPRYYGEAKQVLLGALTSEYLHPKIAIAVDEDVDIFNYADIIWAMTTRVDPEKDVIVLPGLRGMPMDGSLRQEIGQPSQPGWHRVGGKMVIDATKPPTCDPDARDDFERIKPVGWGTFNPADLLS